MKRMTLITSVLALIVPIAASQAPYQVNQPGSTLTANGVVGTATTPAVTSLHVGDTIHFLSTTNMPGAGYEGLLALEPLVPHGGGGFTTSSGAQILNVDLTAPTFTWMFGGTRPRLLPHPGFITVDLPQTAPLNWCVQALVMGPPYPEGYVMSQGCELRVLPAPGPTFPAGPMGDDSSVTVSLIGSGFDRSVRFFGTTYSKFHVSSNGRVTFRSPSASYSPTIAAALGGDPFVGFWTDLNRSAGGSITISSPTPDIVRVDYADVPYYGSPWWVAATFSIVFERSTGTVGLVNLQSIDSNPGIGIGFGPSQFLGLSPGAPSAWDQGRASFHPGSANTASTGAMIYDWLEPGGPGSSQGLPPSLAAGTSQILFSEVSMAGLFLSYHWTAQ